MARIRTIKPEFFRNEQVASVSPLAALLFPGLWTVADRNGRLRDRPRQLMADLMPLRNVDLEPLLAELEAAHLIVRYSVANVAYIAIPNFLRHQRPHPKEPPSEIPPPDAPLNGKPRRKTASREQTRQAAEKNGEPCFGSTQPVRKGREGDLGREGDPFFERFYMAYPKHHGRADAEKAWRQLAPSVELAETIIGSLDGWEVKWPEWLKENRKYVPHPATWLRGHRWEDEPSGEVRPKRPATYPPDVAAQRRRLGLDPPDGAG